MKSPQTFFFNCFEVVLVFFNNKNNHDETFIFDSLLISILSQGTWNKNKKHTVPGLADSGCSLNSWERQCTQRWLDVFLQESTVKKISDPHKRPSEFPILQYFLARIYAVGLVYRDIANNLP